MKIKSDALMAFARRQRTPLLIATAIAAVALMICVSPGASFIDEYDNFLGARILLKEGGFIYSSYFTQHMPLTYLLTVPFVAIFGTHLILIRIAFALVLSSWMLVMSRHILRAFGAKYAIPFVLSLALAFAPTWSNMVMAETWIAWSTMHALILFVTRKSVGVRPTRAIAVMVLLGAIPVLSALAYAPLSLAIYGLAIWWLVERRTSVRRRFVALAIVLGVAPYAILTAVLLATGSFNAFIFQAYTFNVKYYAPANPSSPTNAVEGFISIFHNFFEGLWNALTRFSAPNQPMAFLFTVLTLVSLAVLYSRRRWALAGWMTVFTIFAGSRGIWDDPQRGFAAALAFGPNARHGEALFYVGALTILLAARETADRRPLRHAPPHVLRWQRIVFGTVAAMCIVLLSMTSTYFSLAILRNLGVPTRTVGVNTGPNTASNVINLVNGKNGTYWLAPSDWDQNIYVESHNINAYYYFFDYVGACPQCFSQVATAIEQKKPRVIWLDPRSPYAPHAGPAIVATFAKNYFTVTDSRLSGFYFLSRDRANILHILSVAGYSVPTS